MPRPNITFHGTTRPVGAAPRSTRVVHIPMLWKDTGVPMPDFSYGLCTTVVGRSINDGGFSDTQGAPAYIERAEAKILCDYCPMKAECAQWTERAEDPPGAWGGVYAGRDQRDRRGMPWPMDDTMAWRINQGLEGFDRHIRAAMLELQDRRRDREEAHVQAVA